MDVLKNSPQIAELLEILDRNGLTKEKDEVTSLVDYIGSMENTLSSMMNELSEMRNEVRQIHDNTLRAKCSQLLQNTGDKVKQAAKMVGTAKDNLIRGAERAIQEFKLRGKDALIKAVEAMKIPKTIQALQKCFGNLSKHKSISLTLLNAQHLLRQCFVSGSNLSALVVRKDAFSFKITLCRFYRFGYLRTEHSQWIAGASE